MKYRKDSRTEEQFKIDIATATRKEKFLLELFLKELKLAGFDVDFKNNGVDNTGKLVARANCNADFKVIIKGDSGSHEGLYEIKNSPVSHKCTFKVNNLKQYVKQKANILLFYGTGRIGGAHDKIDKNNTRWAIITPDKIQQMLDDHEPYNEFMFGGKPCIKVLAADYHKYFESHKLST